MAKIKKTRNNTANDMRKKEPLFTIGKTANWSCVGIWKSVLRILKMLKINLHFDPSIPCLVICSVYNILLQRNLISCVHFLSSQGQRDGNKLNDLQLMNERWKYGTWTHWNYCQLERGIESMKLSAKWIEIGSKYWVT